MTVDHVLDNFVLAVVVLLLGCVFFFFFISRHRNSGRKSDRHIAGTHLCHADLQVASSHDT